MKKILVGIAAVLLLAACSKSENVDGANVETDDKSGVEGTPAEGAQPSERPAGDGTVRIKAGNTEVVVDKDGNKVTTGNVKVDKDGVTTGGVKVNKDGTTTVGGIKVGKDGVVNVPH